MHKINLKTKPVILIIFILLNINSYSQDTLNLSSDKYLLSKVIEVTLNEIKYKKYDNLNGPIYTILKKDIISINYKNGTKDILYNWNQNGVITYKNDTNYLKLILRKKRFFSSLSINQTLVPNWKFFYNSGDYNNPITIKSINGYNFNSHLSLGLGIEYIHGLSPLQYIAISPELFYYTSKKVNSPFINVFGGVLCDADMFEKKTFGATLGYNFIISKRNELMLGFGFKQIQLPKKVYNWRSNNRIDLYNYLLINAGISF